MIKKIIEAIKSKIEEHRYNEAMATVPCFRIASHYGIGDGEYTGVWTITHKDWAWFKPLLDEGVVYDFEIEKSYVTHGYNTHQDIRYHTTKAGMEKVRSLMAEHGWKTM